MNDFEKNGYTACLIEANGIDPNDFQQWVFCPGMLFNSPRKWWKDRGGRDFPHEGIDLCLYKGRSERVFRLDDKTRIPAMQDGVVRALYTDFLGQAVVVEHEVADCGNNGYITVYAHTKPLDGIVPGVGVKKNEIIATIADTRRSKANIIPHLHLSIGRTFPDFDYDTFVWNHMRNPDRVSLRDPLSVMDWPYQVLDIQNRYCMEL